MENKQDEQHLENSAIASRQRMTDLDWVREAMVDDDLKDEIDPDFFLSTILSLYKYHHDDAQYIGVAVVRMLNAEAETLGLRKKDEFNEENNNE